jgi:hypothetical protein
LLKKSPHDFRTRFAPAFGVLVDAPGERLRNDHVQPPSWLILGSLFGTGIFLFGMPSFDSLWWALLPAALYFGIPSSRAKL